MRLAREHGDAAGIETGPEQILGARRPSEGTHVARAGYPPAGRPP